MQVFRLYFKVLRQMFRSIMLYILTFSFIFIAFMLYYRQDGSQQEYASVKAKVAVLDYDHSKLSEELVDFLNREMEVVTIENEEEALREALFFYQIHLAVTVPKGFEDDFRKHEAQLDTQMKPDAVYGFLAQHKITSYLDKVRVYMDCSPQKDFSEIDSFVQEDLQQSASVSLYEKGSSFHESEQFERNSLTTFFNYLTYMFLAIVVLSVGMVMGEFNRVEVRMRNIVSPLHSISYNLQLLLANLCFCIGLWLFFLILIFLILPAAMKTMEGFLYACNSLVFMIVCLGLSYLIAALFSNVRHSEDAINGIANIISLGSSFLCGAFVPQAILSSDVLMAASFTPAYWYIRFNNEVSALSAHATEAIGSLLGYMGIEILFGITFVVLAMAVTKSKRSSKEL